MEKKCALSEGVVSRPCWAPGAAVTEPWRLRFGEQWQGLLINWMCCGVLAELFQKKLVL